MKLKYIEPIGDEIEEVEDASNSVPKNIGPDFYRKTNVGDKGTVTDHMGNVFPYTVMDKLIKGQIRIRVKTFSGMSLITIATQNPTPFPKVV